MTRIPERAYYHDDGSAALHGVRSLEEERVMAYLWLKAVHIIFVVAWFAGLFYLPRLFVYHCDAHDPASDARFKLMERRLYLFTLMNTAIAVACGVGLLIAQPAWLTQPWMRIKIALVLALFGFQWSCWRQVVAFRDNRNRHDGRWFRWYNEIPTVLLFAIVILVVVKPAF
jgi:putative membrane protein